MYLDFFSTKRSYSVDKDHYSMHEKRHASQVISQSGSLPYACLSRRRKAQKK